MSAETPRGSDPPFRGAVRATDWLAVVGLTGLVAWLFRETLFGGGVFYKRDIHLVWHPQVEGFVRAVAAGSWPVWDPSPAFGQPLLADPGAQVLYPLTWLNLVLRPWTYYTLFAFTHVLLSGLAFYALARRWRLGPPGAFVAAGLWTFCGPFLSLVDLWHHFASAAWIPVVFLAAEIAFEGRRLVHAIALALALAGQILAGSADMCAMTAMAVAALAASRLGRATPTERRGILLSGLVAGVVAGGVTAGLWWPALDLLLRSSRRSFPAELRTYWSVHPLGLLETLVPGLWSNLPLKAALRTVLFESREPFLASLYLGLPALGLVGAGAAASSHPRRRLLLVLGAGALFIALGRHTRIYDAVLFVLPPLRILRYPVKAMVLVAFAWAALAGLGVEAWRAPGAVPRRRWVALVAVPAALLTALGAAAALTLRSGGWGGSLVETVPGGPSLAEVLAPTARALAWGSALAAAVLLLALRRLRPRGREATLAALVAIVALGELVAYHQRPNPVAPKELYTYRPEILEALGDLTKVRLYSYDYTMRGKAREHLGREHAHVLERTPEGWPAAAASALGLQMALAPQTAGRWGIRQSFEIDYRGLFPEPLARLTMLLRAGEETPGHIKLLRIGAVTHVIALHERGLEELKPVRVEPGLFTDAARLFAVPQPLPRTFVVGRSRIANGLEALRTLLDPGFDPSREVLLAEGPIAGASPEAPAAAEPFTGSSRIVAETADRVRIEAELVRAGFVVLVDSYDPGWRATVDGREAAVSQANVTFRAVAVPAGRHVVEHVYRPRAVTWGLAFSGASLALALAALAGRRGRMLEL